MIYVLSVLAALVILVVVLLNISVTLKVHYDDESNVFRCNVRYLFFTYVIAPEEKKKKSRKKEKNAEKEKDKTSVKDRIKDRGIGGFLEDMKNIVSSAWSLIAAILKRAVLQKLTVCLTVVGEDAADTAIMYGYANSVVYPIVSALVDNVDKYNDLLVDIKPDFSENVQAKVEFDAVIKLKPVKFISAIVEGRSSAEKLISAINRKPKDKVKNSKETTK